MFCCWSPCVFYFSGMSASHGYWRGAAGMFHILNEEHLGAQLPQENQVISTNQPKKANHVWHKSTQKSDILYNDK